MAKYQLQASEKWSFDFIKEMPVGCENSQFNWEPLTTVEMPKFYHQTIQPSRLFHQHSSASDERSQLFNKHENICALSRHISSPPLIIQNAMAVSKRKAARAVSSASTSFATTTICSSQRKITGECLAGR